MRHQKKRYVLPLAIESFMVPYVLYAHRGDVTVGIEPETCITIIVVTARAGSNAVAGSRKLCWHDVWLSRSCAGNRKILRVKGPGSSTVQRVRWEHVVLVLQGVHGMVDKSVDEKGHGELGEL